MIKKRTNSYNCNYELLFKTKNKEHLFVQEDVQIFLKKRIEKVFSLKESKLYQLHIASNFIYIRFSLSPKYSITNLTKSLKGDISREFNKTFKKTELWSKDYLVSTLNSPKETILLKGISKKNDHN